MLKNYLRIALRNLLRYKSFSFINVFGLALGTACCLYILLYVQDECSYDEHHQDVERIYRITSILSSEGDPNHMATCSPPIPGTMKQDFPEVQEATRLVGMFTSNQQIFRYDGKVYYESDGAYADSTFFNIFTYHFIHGNKEQALAEPFNIVLSASTAQKFFGTENPVGKIVEMDTNEGRQQLTVTAVINDQLGKSHINANFLLSMNSGGIGSYAMTSTEWAGNNFTNAYIKLKPNTSVAALEAKLPAFLERHGSDYFKQASFRKQLSLQPVQDIHTTAGLTAEPSETVSPTLLSILLAIAGLIQLIACINFMNLSTARAAQRAREIGIRKVLGASVLNITTLISTEFIKLVLIALVLSIPLAWWAMHQWLNDFAYRVEMQWWMFALAGVLTLVIAFLTISVQSVKAALANPVESLKNE